MSDDIGFNIFASIDGLKESMAQAAQSIKTFSSESKETIQSVGESFEKLNGIILKFSAVLAGGIIFKDVIEATEQWNEQLHELSAQLGIEVDAAANLNAALKLIGVSTESYTSAALKLDRQVRTNEESINELGVATRNASTGALLPQQQIMLNAINSLNQYEAGTNRNVAAQIIFGRGTGDLTNLLRLNSDILAQGAEDAEKFGLKTGEDAVDGTKQFQKSVAELDLALKGLEISLGDKIIPALTKVAEGFTTVVVPAINKTIDALTAFENKFGEAIALALAGNDKDLAAAVKDEANGVPYGKTPEKTEKPKADKQVPNDLLKGGNGADNAKQEDKLRELAIQKDKIMADGEVQIEDQKNKQLLASDQITNTQYLQRKLALQQQLDAIDLQAAQDKVDAIQNDEVAQEKASNDMIALKQKQAIQEMAIRDQITNEADKDNQKLAQSINTQFENMFTGIISGTKSIKQAFSDFAQSVIQDIAQIESKKLMESLLGGGTGSSGEGGGLGGMFSSLLGGSSGGGGGQGASFLSSLIPSFDVGTMSVPRTTLATVHKGEMIVPANQAGAARSGGMGTTVNMTVYAQDAGSFRQNQGQMMADMNMQLRKSQRNL